MSLAFTRLDYPASIRPPGAVRTTTSELLTAADVDDIARRRVNYRAPGAWPSIGDALRRV